MHVWLVCMSALTHSGTKLGLVAMTGTCIFCHWANHTALPVDCTWDEPTRKMWLLPTAHQLVRGIKHGNAAPHNVLDHITTVMQSIPASFVEAGKKQKELLSSNCQCSA